MTRFLTGVVPNAGLTVTATGHEEEAGYRPTWTVTVIQRVAASSPVDSQEFSQASASCPAGQHILGMGGSINNAQGNVLIDDSRPTARSRRRRSWGSRTPPATTPTGT